MLYNNISFNKEIIPIKKQIKNTPDILCHIEAKDVIWGT